jgi:hypothetical protein
MAQKELHTLRSVLAEILTYNRQIAAERIDLACPHCGLPLASEDRVADRRVAIAAEELHVQR